MRSIKLLFLFGIRSSCLKSGRSRSLYLSIRRARQQIVVILGAYQLCQKSTDIFPTSCCQGQLHTQRKLLRIINVDLDATDRLLIIYSAFVKYLRKNRNTTEQCISYLWTLIKFMFQLVGRSCIIFSLSLGSP